MGVNLKRNKVISEFVTEFIHNDTSNEPVLKTRAGKTDATWGTTDSPPSVFIVQETETEDAFNIEMDTYNSLSDEQRVLSDRESMRVRNKTNQEYYDEMLPLIRNRAASLKFAESIDMSNIKSIADIRNKVLNIEFIEDYRRDALKDIFDELENTLNAVKNNINMQSDKFNPLSKNIGTTHITREFVSNSTEAVKIALSKMIKACMDTGISVAVISTIIVILISVIIGYIYDIVMSTLGALNPEYVEYHRGIIEKYVIADFKANLDEIHDEADDCVRMLSKEIKNNMLDEIGLEDGDVNLQEEYNWDEMEFGLDALNMDYDDDTSTTVDEFDKDNADEESEFYNYAIEKEVYTDEEVEQLIKRYMKIKDANTFQKVLNMFKDFRAAVRESAKKHGNFFIDTDEKDDEKDDKRMMTKAEAIAVVDATLASKYRMYLLAFEHFRRDSAKSLTFTLFLIIFFTCLTISGLVILLPIGVVIGATAGIGNWYAFFRDLKRTRLVIIKEIERIDNTVAKLSADKNTNKEQIKTLLEIKRALIIQAGYDEKSPKWNKLKDPAVIKKLTEMIDYFGDALSIDDIRVNIVEADAEDAASGEDDPPKDDSNNDDPEEESTDDEGEDAGDDNNDSGQSEDFNDAQEDYLNSDPTDNTKAGFDEGGSEQEEQYKLQYCVKNLDTLYEKYTNLKRDIIASDTYKIVNENDEDKNKSILVELVNELGIALDNLNAYIEVGDKSTYPVTALKLSIHQNVLRVIDGELERIITKINKDIVAEQ